MKVTGEHMYEKFKQVTDSYREVYYKLKKELIVETACNFRSTIGSMQYTGTCHLVQ